MSGTHYGLTQNECESGTDSDVVNYGETFAVWTHESHQNEYWAWGKTHVVYTIDKGSRNTCPVHSGWGGAANAFEHNKTVQHIKTMFIHVRISVNTYVHIQIDKYIGKSISTYATLPHTHHAWNSHRWNGCDRRCPCTGNNNALDLICFKLPFIIVCPW